MKRKGARAVNAALGYSKGKSALTGNIYRAFTLIELLVVVAVIVIMMRLAIPAFNAISGSGNFGSEIYNIAGTLEQARAYAMGNNTYVLAGIVEVSAAQDTSASPAVSGTGRVVMAVVASRDGTRPYQTLINMAQLTKWYTGGGYGTGGAFVPVTKAMPFQNIHLVDLQSGGSTPPASGNMARPTVSPYYDIANASCTTQAEFGWPLGTKIFNGNPAPQYIFYRLNNFVGTVIEFDPQGSARIFNSTYQAAIPQLIEIGLQPSQGTSAAGPPANQNAGQLAAIQIDGMSGATRIYRP
jgi:prepilin-type N-terminal cleavage/methylation domain-containing protein